MAGRWRECRKSLCCPVTVYHDGCNVLVQRAQRIELVDKQKQDSQDVVDALASLAEAASEGTVSWEFIKASLNL